MRPCWQQLKPLLVCVVTCEGEAGLQRWLCVWTTCNLFGCAQVNMKTATCCLCYAVLCCSGGKWLEVDLKCLHWQPLTPGAARNTNK